MPIESVLETYVHLRPRCPVCNYKMMIVADVPRRGNQPPAHVLECEPCRTISSVPIPPNSPTGTTVTLPSRALEPAKGDHPIAIDSVASMNTIAIGAATIPSAATIAASPSP